MQVHGSDGALSDLWAKSPKRGEPRGETLLNHTQTVLARVETLAGIFPGIAARVGEERLWHRAALAAVLHDFGKVASGFQQQLRESSKPWGHRHEVLSLAFVDWVLPHDPEGDLSWVIAGVVSHHRDKAIIDEKYPPPDEDDDPDDPVTSMVSDVTDRTVLALAGSIRDQLPRWLSASKLPLFAVNSQLPNDPARDFRLHAKRRIYRALALYRRLFSQLNKDPHHSPSNLQAIALRGIVLLADHSASAHEVPPAMPTHNIGAVLKRLNVGHSDTLFEHQQQAASCIGSALLTAPTGSGKTEAAILWSTRQRDNSGAGRLFYVLPYQASINAMHQRLSAVFPNLVTLQHSRALQAIYRRLLENDRYDPATASLIARRQQALARLHYHPIRVLTPYQLLRSVFRLKGYEMILTDAMNGLMVFDEIHAYEPNRLGMILAMQEYMANQLGVQTLVMSATIPSLLRDLIPHAIGDCTSISASSHLYQTFARHTLCLLHEEINTSAISDRIVSTAKSGKSVLVVCNTVARSIELYDELSSRLRETGIALELLHSRFNSVDRFRKETSLSKHLGTRTRASESPPAVMVATQVVEVSLDIDFDVLFTEAAPLESLIQRFGRVNRARKHPSCPVYVLSEPKKFPHVYEESYVCAALAQLEDFDGEVIDESQLGTKLDEIYSGQLAEAWLEQIEHGRSETQAACIAGIRAFQSDPGLLDAFERMFDGTEVLPASLVPRYQEAADEDPIAASSLLVPISYAQLAILRRHNRLRRLEGADYDVWAADVPYDSDYGLKLSA